MLILSVRGRFLLAFLGISAFAVLAAAAAMWAFLELGHVVARITEERAPAALASLELSRQAERIAAAAPALLAARSEEARTKVAAGIRAQLAGVEALRARLRETATDPEALRAIESAAAGLDRNLDALDGLVAERLGAARRKEELLRRLSTTLIGTQRLVAPGIFVLESRLAAERRSGAGIGAGLSETVARLVPLQKAKLEIAAVNEHLLRAAEANGIADLPLLAFPLRRSLDMLEGLTPELEPQLQGRFAERMSELKALAEGPGSLPAARDQELQALARGERLLAENATLSAGLTQAVDRLVAAAKDDITAAGSEAAMVRRTSTAVLLAAVLASLLSSALIVWFYVDRNLVSRLRALAQSMLAIAAGNLRAPLPTTGPDELGQMAEALRVFRDTAAEVEEQRLRERQVVLDTINYGVLILDPELRVRMYNRAFRDLWDLPDEVVRARPTLEELLLEYRSRGLHGVPEVEWDDYVARRLAEVRAASTAPQEWHRPDGRVLQYDVVALPDGGRMLTYFDLTRLKRTEEALIAAKQQAEEASRAKSAFLASMSHELRTPLNAIIGFTRLVMRRAKDALPARQYENLEKILVSGEHLLSLINSILDLSKIEAGRMEVKKHPFALRPLLELCIETIRPLVRRHAVELIGKLETAPLMLVNDEEKLKQIVINLLSNAAKFTENGSIVLKASERGGTVEIWVRDTGIGISADKLEAIFEEFRQVDAAAVPTQPGTGLGLSISRRLARLLGGEITVVSEVGRGSTFTLSLPLQPTIMVAPEAPAAAIPPGPPKRPAAGRLVLAIDDDPNVIYLLKENLADAGYRVEGALRAEEGLRKARELQPQAITLDIAMPGSDGWQVLHALKADPLTRDIPVIMLSIVDQRDLGFRLGAADYLLKPIEREALLHTLERVAPHRRHLLLVDDDPQVRDLVPQLLEGVGVHVETTADGAGAVATMRARRPDCVLLDLLMPGMDGFAVLEAMRDAPELAAVPVIVLTAKDLSTAELATLRTRVRAVIEKRGLNRETLVRDIRQALEGGKRSVA